MWAKDLAEMFLIRRHHLQLRGGAGLGNQAHTGLGQESATSPADAAMLGFKRGASAARFCRAYDELRLLSVPVQTGTNMFLPLTAGYTSYPGPSRCLSI